jgi:imidazolonepropionase-like amidohydrolase
MPSFRRAALLVSALALAAVPVLAAPKAQSKPAGETRYTVLFASNKAGTATTRSTGKGQWLYTFEFNDRGRGPSNEEHATVDAHGLPVHFEVTGHDYWKNPVDEHFDVKDSKASWSNASEKEERPFKAPAYYLPMNGVPQDIELLARALLAAGGSLKLLPTGEARIERVATAEAEAGGHKRAVELYRFSGLGFSPFYIWFDARTKALFDSDGGWMQIVEQGWEGVLPKLHDLQEAQVKASEKELAQRLAHHPAVLAIHNARLFDPESLQVTPGTTVVVAGDRIQAVGADGQVEIPAGAEVIDAGGKMMLPGMWDMHTHLSSLDGLFHLAAGVTTVRDLANDLDFLLDLRKRWNAGDALGPRVIMAGFMDGPGPYAGPTKVLVSTEAEALSWVDRYADLGYVQIKIYSSLDPKLVPAIIQRAHARGLRVSGHIPNGMTAEQAVRAGFDEIQHVNFLFLNFIEGVDTRTPARFSAVAEHGAELDLASPRAESFFSLLQEHHTVSDPTLVAFEGMLTDKPGEMSHTFAAVADRLPPQVQRGLLAGGMAPKGKEELYRSGFAAMEKMVKALHDHGITIVAGTDGLAGLSYQRELELYVESGIPAPEVLRIATLVPARVMKMDKDLGTVAPGKLADLILVDGDPTARISDIRRVALTVKGGTVYDPAKLYGELGILPMK